MLHTTERIMNHYDELTAEGQRGYVEGQGHFLMDISELEDDSIEGWFTQFATDVPGESDEFYQGALRGAMDANS